MKAKTRRFLAIVLAGAIYSACRSESPNIQSTPSSPPPPANLETSPPVSAGNGSSTVEPSASSSQSAQISGSGLDVRGEEGARIYSDLTSVNPSLNLYAPKRGYYAGLTFFMDGQHSSNIWGYGASGSGGLTFYAALTEGRFNFLSKTRNEDSVYAATTHQLYSAGAPRNGFGSGHQVELESSTGRIRVASQINTLWTDANDDSRTSALAFQTISNAGPLTEHLRITGHGKIGVGTENPTENLHVVGTLRVEGLTDCVFGNGVASANCVSDRRLKSRVRPIANAVEKLQGISGVEFVWNEKSRAPGKASMGVIAQDVATAFPTAVITNAEGYLAVDYAALVAPLIQSVKELKSLTAAANDKIEKLENENSSLQSENSAMKAELSKLMSWTCAQKLRPSFCQ